MSVKSLSIAEWGNTMMIESMAHWWKLLHLQYYDPGVGSNLFEKKKRRTIRLLSRLVMHQTRSSTQLCVKQRAVFSGLF